eukprot:TRINITY_DN4091_c0_g1_i1.p1 TRINITY_DN4091_c0_g1~~TRINITY_DN4091_c0_g1_i1.p1  ORF type:complete len:149 (+),score=9.80 TRINITY_DN4091_c0_g1_i1:64-510(+)
MCIRDRINKDGWCQKSKREINPRLKKVIEQPQKNTSSIHFIYQMLHIVGPESSDAVLSRFLCIHQFNATLVLTYAEYEEHKIWILGIESMQYQKESTKSSLPQFMERGKHQYFWEIAIAGFPPIRQLDNGEIKTFRTNESGIRLVGRT